MAPFFLVYMKIAVLLFVLYPFIHVSISAVLRNKRVLELYIQVVQSSPYFGDGSSPYFVDGHLNYLRQK